jgi:hypothetical protein
MCCDTVSEFANTAYYRSLLTKYSQKSRSTSGKERRDSEESDDTLYDKGDRPLKSLPRIPNDRFITTTLKNAGIESDFDRLSYTENGEGPPKAIANDVQDW